VSSERPPSPAPQPHEPRPAPTGDASGNEPLPSGKGPATPGDAKAEHCPLPPPPTSPAALRDVVDAIVVDSPAPSYGLPMRGPAPSFHSAAAPALAPAGDWMRWLEAQPAEYMVPQRFGMSAILGMMTALALLFALLRALDAHPAIYLFFGSLGLVISTAQMLNNARPRVASVVAGAILVPLMWAVLLAMDRQGPPLLAIACIAIVATPVGAFLGYAAGTVAAGVFLVMDRLERWWTRRLSVALPAAEGAARMEGPQGKAS
jgi:hypothetical protein